MTARSTRPLTGRESPTRRQRIGWYVMAGASLLVALTAMRYAVLGDQAAPENLIEHTVQRPWLFYIHIAAGTVALLAGPWQFLKGLRRSRPGLHRATGRLYVAACAAGGLAALPLALNSPTGMAAGSGFFILGILWLATTATGLVFAIRGNIAAHRRWMVRSFAVTMSALTLRLILPLGLFAGVDTVYIASAWLCWAINLAVAELILRSGKPGTATIPVATVA